MRLEQEAEMIAAKLAEARQRASEELQRVERLERLLNDALRSHEHEELDGAVVSISAELQVRVRLAHGAAGGDNCVPVRVVAIRKRSCPSHVGLSARAVVGR
jgi:hypothetical protein